jgi:hypothetical protein
VKKGPQKPASIPFVALVVGAGLLLQVSAQAMETARVLPAGISRFRIVGAETNEVKDTFNSDGDLQGLSYSLNRSVTVNDIRNSSDTATKAQLDQLVSALNNLQPGLGDKLAASSANLYSDFTMRQTVYLAAWEYGLNDRLSLGIRAPMIRRDAHVSFSATPSPAAASIAASVGPGLSPTLADGIGRIASLDTAAFQQSLFTSKGYLAPAGYDKTQLGDVEYGAKYNFYRTDIVYSSFLLGMSAPTGAKPDIRNPFDQGNGKGSWIAAGQLLQEIYPSRGITLEGAARMGFSFKDTRDRAVPKDANDSLPSLLPQDGQVQSVTRQRAPQLDSELAAQYTFPGERFYTWGAYQYSRKGQDQFSGPGNLYYQGLSQNTDWSLTAGEMGVGFSTIPAFRNRKFAVPLEVTLQYTKPISGKNTPMASIGRMDFLFYF